MMTEKEFREKYEGRVKEVTLDELPAFINELLDQEHEYGTIVIAIAIAAAATGWACNKHDNGHITGFQASFVTWEFIRHWGTPHIGQAGARFLDFADALYPQYRKRFTTIPRSAVSELQKMAQEKLQVADRDNIAIDPVVRNHWRWLADGNAPFGLTIVE